MFMGYLIYLLSSKLPYGMHVVLCWQVEGLQIKRQLCIGFFKEEALDNIENSDVYIIKDRY